MIWVWVAIASVVFFGCKEDDPALPPASHLAWQHEFHDVTALAMAGQNGGVLVATRGAYDLVKVGEDGEVWWTEDDEQDFAAAGISERGDVTLVGYHDQGFMDYELRVAQFDPYGNLQWRQAYDWLPGGLLSCATIASRDVLITATGHSSYPGGQPLELLQLDGNIGAIEIQDTLPTPPDSLAESSQFILPGWNREWYVIAKRYDYFRNAGAAGVITRVSQTGEPVWSYQTARTAYDQYHGAVLVGSGDIVAVGCVNCGGGDMRTLVTRLTADGAVVWEREYDIGSDWDRATSVLTVDSTIVVLGWSMDAGNPDAIATVLFLNAQGEQTAVWRFAELGSVTPFGAAVAQDGSLIIGAASNVWQQFTVFKTKDKVIG